MTDFSASRRLKTQDSNNYASNQDSGLAMASEYRPFSTLMHDKQNDEEVVRQSLYGGALTTNQPMSLELEHKRSVPLPSKSVQKPKKGILKNSSSYLDSQSLKK